MPLLAGDAVARAQAAAAEAKDAAAEFADHATNRAQGQNPGIWSTIKSKVTGGSHASSAGDTVGDTLNQAGQQAADSWDSAKGTAGDYARELRFWGTCMIVGC